MIVDTSAVVAILLREPGSHALVDAILDAPTARMSAGSALELQVVASRRSGDPGRVAALTLLDDLSIDIAAVTAALRSLSLTW